MILGGYSADGTIDETMGSKRKRWEIRNQRHSELILGGDAGTFALAMALVVFLVLAIVLTTSRPYESYSSVNLPKVLHPVTVGFLAWGANRQDAINIWITRGGDIFINNERTSASALPGQITLSLHKGSERRAYIRADARVPYSTVKSVLNSIQSAGVEDVSFLADQRKK